MPRGTGCAKAEPQAQCDALPQYWSVRTSKRSCGTIDVGWHFDAWERAYLELGRLYEVSFVVEGYLSTGSGDVRLSVD